MERTIDRIREAIIGRYRQKDIGGFDGNFEFMKIMILQNLGVVERGFHQGFGARLTIFFQQIAFQ